MRTVKKTYVDICDNFKNYLMLENLNKNSKLSFLKKLILKIKYEVLTTLQIIRKKQYEKNDIYVYYTKKGNKKLDDKINTLLKITSTSVILSDELLLKLKYSKQELIQECIETNKQNKEAFKIKIYEVFKYILDAKKENIQESNIYILMQHYHDEYKNILISLVQDVKCMNIVTYNIKEFKIFESEIYNNFEIPMIITNNKRKSLSKAKYILNIDFTEKQLNEYNINRDAIILNVSKNDIKKLRGFCGTIINNITILKIDYKNYLKRRFNKENVYCLNNEAKINRLIGNNGYVL